MRQRRFLDKGHLEKFKFCTHVFIWLSRHSNSNESFGPFEIEAFFKNSYNPKKIMLFEQIFKPIEDLNELHEFKCMTNIMAATNCYLKLYM